MRILSAELHDYLSFRDCPRIEFREGINLVVGLNNSGKSALLKALNPNLPAQANRSEERFRDSELPLPSVTLNIRTSGERIRQAALEYRSQIMVPLPPDTQDVDQANRFLAQLFETKFLDTSIHHHGGGSYDTPKYPSHRIFNASGIPAKVVALHQINGKLEISGLDNVASDTFYLLLSSIAQQEIFYFAAERLNVGASSFANIRRLSHNAADLPAFLLTLMGERGSIIDRLKDHVRGIFSSVGNLSVRPNSETGQIEVVIWPNETMDRPELSFPLSSSGTGLGQVLAILSVVMTTAQSVIIIDEINSFLHPGAVKALLRLFQTEYSHHQYIISTHSPEVISFSNPSIIHAVRRHSYKSQVHSLEPKQVDGIRDVVRQLGVSMTDIFLADRVIWVEGPSEELCFPELYLMATGCAVSNQTKILSVIATGDFMRKRDKELVFEIYKRLSSEVSPLVSSVSFSFDTEDLKDQEKLDMKRESREMIDFLPRRHLECYLVHPQSIADFIAQQTKENLTEAPVPTANEVEAALKDLAGTPKFKVTEWKNDLEDKEWLARVDAANLIIQVCTDVSETRVTFNKKRNTLLLLQLVIKNNPAQLAELGEYVRRLVDGQG